MKPLVSIITVVYNACSTIEKSIKSVVGQKNKNYQYIIIDGGSTDGTIEVIKRYLEDIDLFITERDNGIYDAMNKGIDAAKGEYLYFLGSDDFIYSSSVTDYIGLKIGAQRPDLILGQIEYTHGSVINSVFSHKILLHNTIHHQGTFYKAKYFEKFRYDISFKLISDYELNLRLYLIRRKITMLSLEYKIALCTDNGISRSLIGLSLLETNKIREKCLGKVPSALLSLLYTIKLKIWDVRYNKL